MGLTMEMPQIQRDDFQSIGSFHKFSVSIIWIKSRFFRKLKTDIL